MTTVVFGTAGHIDHGKTALLRALTGIDADRLPEERRRGMTIDVGFAHLDLDDGSSIDFVDVPGHDGLIGNMLVGAGEIDAALLVIAADDGPRAQTLEHLVLLDALEIAHGMAVITKTDLVDAERLAIVRAEVGRLLGRTSLHGAEVLAASATTGEGIVDVRQALIELRDRVVARFPGADSAARLAIDRAFGVRGRGAVVTGTLRGSIGRDDQVRIEPLGRLVRVREVQVHGAGVERAYGGRTALNLAGVDVGELARGQAVLGASERAVRSTDALFVALRAPVEWSTGRGAWAPPQPGGEVRVHVGTDQVSARVARIGRALEPIQGHVVRVLRLDRPIAVAAGDRFALRLPAPVGTVGAGRVLDTLPPRGPARRRASAERLGALVLARDAAALDTASLELHGAIDGEPLRLAGDVQVFLEGVAEAAVEAHRAAEPSSAGLLLGELRRAVAREAERQVALREPSAARVADRVVDDLIRRGTLARAGERVASSSSGASIPDALRTAMERLELALDVPLPPSLAEAARAAGCPPEGVAALARSGRITRLEDDLAWSASAYQRLAARALAMATREPLSPAAFRDATGTSRRYAIAILEDLDRRGILRRTPDGHMPGPRAPR